MVTTPDTQSLQEALANAQGRIDGLMAKDVTIGKTHFVINALLPMEAFDVMEEIREVSIAPANLASILDNPSPSAIGMTLAVVLSGLPKKVVKSIQAQMFTAVTFTNESAVSPQVLAGREAMAFQGLGPFDVYNMTVRCLAVNFLESSLDFLSHLSVQGPNIVD